MSQIFLDRFTLDDMIAHSVQARENMLSKNLPFDIKARVYYSHGTPESRTTPALNGYRPAHQVKENLETSGIHLYPDQDLVYPGESAIVLIRFLAPEYYPHCLWVGKRLSIHQGANIVGYAEVLEIFNDLLALKA